MNSIRSFDRIAAAQVARIPKSYHSFMIAATTIGSFWLIVTVVAGMLLTAMAFDNNELLLSLAATVALSPLAEIAKLITRRHRPKTIYVEQMRFKTYSFPSGHSYVSALMSGHLIALAFIYLSVPVSLLIALLLVAFVVLVGVSRVFLGAHFPSDVLAGWLLAVSVLVLTTPIREMLR